MAMKPQGTYFRYLHGGEGKSPGFYLLKLKDTERRKADHATAHDYSSVYFTL